MQKSAYFAKFHHITTKNVLTNMLKECIINSVDYQYDLHYFDKLGEVSIMNKKDIPSREEIFNRIGNTIQRLYQTKFMDNMEEFCQGETKVLLYIYTCGDETVYPSDISKDLLISRQRVTSVLSSLEKKGRVNLSNSKSDRRRIQVEITEEGIDYLNVKRENVQKYFDFFMDRLGTANLLSLASGLDTAVEALIELEKSEEAQ